MQPKGFIALLISCLALSDLKAFSLPDIQVQGLFPNKAVLNINGKLRLLSAGQQSPEGIKLISANTANALILYEGKQYELDLSSRISAAYTAAAANDVRLLPDSRGHYITQVRINGRSVQVLLDTGATSIAMNSQQAARLGIDYEHGPQTIVATAAGDLKSRRVNLNSVQLGPIQLNNVEALVLEGSSPDIILLGNSFLSRVGMRTEGKLMVLTAPY